MYTQEMCVTVTAGGKCCRVSTACAVRNLLPAFRGCRRGGKAGERMENTQRFGGKTCRQIVLRTFIVDNPWP